MDKIVSLCKRRGFIYPSSEIYGGLAGFWDYGPLGVELKNNIKREWWKTMVLSRDNVVGLDASIIMNPQVWQASGHTKAFTDLLIECKTCKKRFRADHIEGIIQKGKYYFVPKNTICPSLGHDLNVGGKTIEPRPFNLLVEASVGAVDKTSVYLRGEITQGVFVNFNNVVNSTRVKIPFGIAQIGKAFRNEITPGNFTYRSREFEQMELEYFIPPDEKGNQESKKVFATLKEERMSWYVSLGINKDKLRFRKHKSDEIAHYARDAEDIEYNAPFGWSEFEGIHHRGDWDLNRHNITYKDKITGKEYTPWVIETSGGVDRTALFFLIDAYNEDGKRIVLKLHPKLAPYKIAVFPLVANKKDLMKKAKNTHKELNSCYATVFDDRGNIGKRYYSQDEIGTPWCVTIDHQTLEDDTVTVRDRDTTKQQRVKIDKLVSFFSDKT